MIITAGTKLHLPNGGKELEILTTESAVPELGTFTAYGGFSIDSLPMPSNPQEGYHSKVKPFNFESLDDLQSWIFEFTGERPGKHNDIAYVDALNNLLVQLKGHMIQNTGKTIQLRRDTKKTLDVRGAYIQSVSMNTMYIPNHERKKVAEGTQIVEMHLYGSLFGE